MQALQITRQPNTYTMKISRLTVDKLGVKLYDKVSAVLAELVSNSYDADATEVWVIAPMGQYLARKENKKIIDLNYTIEVWDNGVGMTPEEVNKFYLRVGAERRKDPLRGDVSRKFKRKVMGRKGVGKLAPFGICERIELLTQGGDLVDGIDENGNPARGYLTAHLILESSKILNDDDMDYQPEVGPRDGTVSPKSGTFLKLTLFQRRQVPSMEDLARQLAQRFGIPSTSWSIYLVDSLKPKEDNEAMATVGDFSIAKMPNTDFTFVSKLDDNEEYSSQVFGPENELRGDLEAGFIYDDRFYPINGWIAYSKDPYKDDLMAGIRIYCHGKIAAQTNIFNRKAGFTGEYDIRSYLIGELHADWLDEEEDLIQTDRRDILWSHELGQAFEKWGQNIVLKLGSVARTPLKRKAWDIFKEVSGIENKLEQFFPANDQKPIRDTALELAKMIGQTMRPGEIQNEEDVTPIVNLSVALAPHVTLDQNLRDAANETDSPLGVITGMLKTARIAELSSFGQIAENRVKVIDNIEKLKDNADTLEAALQKLIEEAPWLIDPQWSPITANQSFTTLKQEFEKYFKEQTGDTLDLSTPEFANKRADFVLSNQDGVLQIIEIKRPKYSFTDTEMIRLDRYIQQMNAFLHLPANAEFTRVYRDFHVTLVCDELGLSSIYKQAFESLIEKQRLTYIGWAAFLVRTRKMHAEFLAEAEKQRRIASFQNAQQ